MAQSASPPAAQSSKPAATNATTATATISPPGKSAAQGAPAGSVRYCSIFTQYQRLNQQSITPWRESNDVVQQAGGWRMLAHEARTSDAPEVKQEPDPNCPPGVAAAHGGQP